MFSFGSIEVKELGLPPKYKSIVQWKNKNNSCWLDTLLTIIVFSVNIRAAINRNMQELALFNRLSTLYDQCQKRHSDTSTADTNVVVEHDIYNQLDFARSYVLNQLRQKLPSLSPGDHESCFEMFSNILKLGPLSKLFSVTLRWEFECDECQYKKARRVTTEITSFPSTTPDFHPLNASFHRSCFTCSAQNQLMTMVMERIPPCLMLHFEQGLPHNRFKVLDFGIQGHLYSVTAAVQYINKPFNHFIVWIRDCKANKWLCCDDLNPVSSWQSRPPKIPPGEIHMVLW
uniref:USP domain-containing protein n=1 Tax=Ciona savignyi TaxID=51511 RepID=H2Y891_CIOSA